MAMSVKEAALRIIQQLPEDVSRANLIDSLTERLSADSAHADSGGGPQALHLEVDEDSDAETVTYHLEREGRFTVLVPDRPVPPLSANIVSQLIEEMRREREDRWLSPAHGDD